MMTKVSAFNVIYDGSADVLYLTRRAEAAATGKQDKYGVVWRYDRDGTLIGATIMDFYESWADDLALLAERLSKRFAIPEPQAQVVLSHALSLHPHGCWLLSAYDLDRQAIRDFDIRGINAPELFGKIEATHPSTGGEGGVHKLLNDIYDFLGGVDGAVELRARILSAIEPVAVSPGVGEPKLTAYETQVLIGTSISGCNMPPDRVFDLKAAWARLYDLGLIDRTDGLAIATPAGASRINALLAAAPTSPEPSPASGDAQARIETLERALRQVREAITAPVNALAITDTVWMPLPQNAASSIETMVDFIDAALSPSTNGAEK